MIALQLGHTLKTNNNFPEYPVEAFISQIDFQTTKTQIGVGATAYLVKLIRLCTENKS